MRERFTKMVKHCPPEAVRQMMRIKNYSESDIEAILATVQQQS
jgi:hypothetical protein